jgi:thioredoxin-related protein
MITPLPEPVAYLDSLIAGIEVGSSIPVQASELKMLKAMLQAYAAVSSAKDAEIERLKVLLTTSKPSCAECTQWVKQVADNKEWTAAVAEGKRIIRAALGESKT